MEQHSYRHYVGLPRGWELREHAHSGSVDLIGVYRVQGWTIFISCDIKSPFMGPDELNIRLTSADDIPSAIETDGITVDLLRIIPFGEARRIIAEWKPRLLAELYGIGEPEPVPDRIESEHDYALVAREYIRIVKTGDRRPIDTLARAWGLSNKTVSARILRARKMGLLEGEPRKPANKLSAKAMRLLDEGAS